MSPIIEEHLSQTEPPEMFALYARAHDLLDKYGLDDADGLFEDLMITADGSDGSGGTADNQAIYNLTVALLDQILTQHQISVVFESGMKSRIEVLEFIKQLDVTEFVDECKRALDDEELDNTDKFVNCMAFVSGLQEEDILQYLDPILDCVIRAMKDFINKRYAFEVTVDSIDEGLRGNFKSLDRFSRAVGGAAMRCHKYAFDEGGAAGLEFSHYYNTNRDYLMSLKPEDLVLELLGWAILSSDGFDSPVKVIMDCVGRYLQDLNTITRIQMLLEQTLLQYRNELTNGVTRIE